MISKGLPSPRVGRKAQELLLLLIACGGVGEVLPLLLQGMAAKQGKAAAACVATARLALAQFGMGLVRVSCVAALFLFYLPWVCRQYVPHTCI